MARSGSTTQLRTHPLRIRMPNELGFKLIARSMAATAVSYSCASQAKTWAAYATVFGSSRLDTNASRANWIACAVSSGVAHPWFVRSAWMYAANAFAHE
jgi:hypothetical protein